MRRPSRRFSRNRAPVLAPLLFTLLTGVLLFLPIALAAQQAAEEGDRLLQWITRLRETRVAVPQWLGQLPIAGGYAARWWQANLADPWDLIASSVRPPV